MNFESYSFSESLNYTKIELSFGTYYLCDGFFIGEINEGEHVDWPKNIEIFEILTSHYGGNQQLGYISNRINHYSTDPCNWIKIEEYYNIITACAIVVYNNSTYMNASIERQFTNKSIKRCISLKQAIEWMESLKEFH